MRFHFSILSAALFATAAFAPLSASGQNNFIGQDQTVNRVIKLRSSELAQKAAENIASRTSRLESSARKTITNPAQVKFEDIKSVPTELKMQPRVAEPRVARQLEEFVSPPAPTGMKPSNSFPRVAESFDQIPQRSTISNNGPLTPNNLSDTDTGTTIESTNNIQTKIQTPKYVNVNQPAQMSIMLNNAGKTPVSNVTLVATLPPHVKLTNSSPQGTSSDGQTYRFSIPQVGSLSTRQVDLTLVPTKKEAIDVVTVVQVESSTRGTPA